MKKYLVEQFKTDDGQINYGYMIFNGIVLIQFLLQLIEVFIMMKKNKNTILSFGMLI